MWNSASESEASYPLTSYGTQGSWRKRLNADPRRTLHCVVGLFGLVACCALAFAVFAYVNSKSDCPSTNQLSLPSSGQGGSKLAQSLAPDAKDVHMVGSPAKQALPSHQRSQLDLSIPRVLLPQLKETPSDGNSETASDSDKPRRPNIFVMLADDLGYGDMASYGHPTQPWNALDEMASKGVRFTQLYADSLCTPSRAQYLTGRLAVRSGMQGKRPRVFIPGSTGGLPDDEVTIAELLRDAGYATGMNGKWHMGINCEKRDDGCHLPFHHGFSEVGTYFPVTNSPKCDESGRFEAYPDPQFCSLYRGKGTSAWQAPAYHENLTETFVSEIKDFITRNRDQPWFFTFYSPQTHDVQYSSKKYQGSTQRGEFGDALNEMAGAAGEIVRHMVSLDLAKDTLFLFFADNGAPVFDCLQAGNNGHMRNGKATGWEGGIRVPAFAYWPGVLYPGLVSDAIVSSADFFPTFASLAGAKPPSDRPLDGVNIAPWLLANKAQPPEQSERPLFFYCGESIISMRYGRYKLHWSTYEFPSAQCVDGQPVFVAGNAFFTKRIGGINCTGTVYSKTHNPPLIFDVVSDPSERFPLEPVYHEELLREATALHDKQTTELVLKPNQLEGYNDDVAPCCDPDNNCVCNYPFPERLSIPPLPAANHRTP